jgi:hypothetical protein
MNRERDDPDMTDQPQFPPADSPRRARVTELVDQGHALADATGIAWAEGAGHRTLPTHGVDEPHPRSEGGGR